MSDLFLDDLVANYMFDDEEQEELGIGFHEMKIVKIRNNVNKNNTPFISITCEKEGKFVRVPYYFSQKALEKSLERLVRLSKKLTGKFTYKQNLDLETLCEVLEPCIGKEVTVQISKKGDFTNYRIM
jgi:hypothetical protein